MRCALLLAVLLACTRASQDAVFKLRIAVTGGVTPVSPDPLAPSPSSNTAQDWIFEPLLGVDDHGNLVIRGT